VLISLVLTVLSTAVLIVHMPSVSASASVARQADGPELHGLGDVFHPGVGLLVLLAIAALNVYKPAGVTAYGWRKQREQQVALRRRAGDAASTPAPASQPAESARAPAEAHEPQKWGAEA